MRVIHVAIVACCSLVAISLSGCKQSRAQGDEAARSECLTEKPGEKPNKPEDQQPETDPNAKRVSAPEQIPDFVHKGISWLVEAQHDNGGWGGGSHANQRLLDPHAVATDPATTSFATMALLRTGHSPIEGDHKRTVKRATEYLLKTVEEASESGPKITDITGTQPQAKLGPLVDTSMTAQCLARLRLTLKEGTPLYQRVDKALDKCLAKLESSQKKDGSWNVGGGWAPVLQSSLGCTALELARATGKKVEIAKLDQARMYQKKNLNIATGRASATEAAGVELYAFAGAQRANAADASAAEQQVQAAKDEGKLAANAPVSSENLQRIGVKAPQARRLAKAFQQNEAQLARLDDEKLLAGFGNNGGEEFLSYLMTSESLVISGGKKWETWNGMMHTRLAKVQNPDGSWNGHHCISSPVFCTAAVVQCLTTDRDAELLTKVAKQAALASND